MSRFFNYHAAVAMLAVGCGGTSRSAVTSRDIIYEHGGTTYQGHVAYPDTARPLRPVLVFHDWHGINDFTREVTRRLADAGCFAFAVDIYGGGVRPVTPDQAEQQATRFITDRGLMRSAILGGYAAALATPGVEIDSQEVHALGYSFGGVVTLEATQLDLPIAKAVTLWGVLNAPNTSLDDGTRSDFLIFHGARDPFTTATDLAAFSERARAAGVKVDLVVYDTAYHAFGIPAVGDMSAQGLKYDADLADQTWARIVEYLNCGSRSTSP